MKKIAHNPCHFVAVPADKFWHKRIMWLAFQGAASLAVRFQVIVS